MLMSPEEEAAELAHQESVAKNLPRLGETFKKHGKEAIEGMILRQRF